MTISRRRFFTLAAAGSLAAGALAVVAVRPALAQAAEAAEFVPGEILIGVNTPEERETVVRQIEQNSQRFRTGNDIAGLSVEKSSGSGLRLKVEFNDTIKGRLRSDPSTERRLLEGLAQQLKATNPNIRYAHPNWITRVDPIEYVGQAIQAPQ